MGRKHRKKIPEIEDRWDPEKRKETSQDTRRQKEEIFSSKSNWKPKVFCVSEMRQVMRRSSFREERGKEKGRDEEREYIYGPDKLHNFPGNVQ